MISFWFRETFASIKKAQASFILSIISTTIAVTLVLASILIIYFTGRFDKSIKEDMTINLFLEEKITQHDREKIHDVLEGKAYINSFKYKSKEEAAKQFITETGEDFTKLIEYNPLPASFEIYLKGEFVQKDSIRKIQSDLGKIGGIEEVFFSADIYYRIIDYLNNSKKYIIGFTILLLFISMYLVFSTNRLILRQRYDELNTMKLIGASLVSIKMPVILTSVIIGIIAGFLSLAIFYFLDRYISIISLLPQNIIQGIIAAAFLLGPLLGIITSYLSLRRISLRI